LHALIRAMELLIILFVTALSFGIAFAAMKGALHLLLTSMIGRDQAA